MMTPTELRQYIIDNPQPLTSLMADSTTEALLWDTLTPNQGFSAEQKALLADLYLLVPNQAELDSANDALKAAADKFVSSMPGKVTTNDELVISAALLTDCLPTQSTYHAAAGWLVGLDIVRRGPEVFPVQEDDE
jgi:hypothetical protein